MLIYLDNFEKWYNFLMAIFQVEAAETNTMRSGLTIAFFAWIERVGSLVSHAKFNIIN